MYAEQVIASVRSSYELRTGRRPRLELVRKKRGTSARCIEGPTTYEPGNERIPQAYFASTLALNACHDRPATLRTTLFPVGPLVDDVARRP